MSPEFYALLLAVKAGQVPLATFAEALRMNAKSGLTVGWANLEYTVEEMNDKVDAIVALVAERDPRVAKVMAEMFEETRKRRRPIRVIPYVRPEARK